MLLIVTKATWGGAQRYVWDIATNLPKDLYEVTVGYGTEGKLSLDLAAAGIKIVRFPSLGRDVALISDIKSFFEMWRYIEVMAPDIVHVNSSKAAGLGALAAWLLHTKRVIFTAHGWPHKEPRRSTARFAIYMASWLTALLSDEVIVVSREDEEIASRMPRIGKKVHRIPLGRSPIPFADPNTGFAAMFGSIPAPRIAADTLRLVSIAELTRNKGVRYAIEAVHILAQRGIDAIFVNAGDGEERRALELLAKDSGISDRIFLPAFIPEAARNLRGFDVFVLPSLKEGLPYAMMEAIMAGIPIVASSVVERDFNAFRNVTFVPPGDGLALADAIQAHARRARAETQSDPFPLSQMLARHESLYLAR